MLNVYAVYMHTKLMCSYNGATVFIYLSKMCTYGNTKSVFFQVYYSEMPPKMMQLLINPVVNSPL